MLLGWCLSELSALLTIPKVRTDWPELAGTPGEGHCTQQVVAGQEETEEKTEVGVHLGGGAACGAEAGTEEGAAQARRLAPLAATGLASSGISRCGVAHGLCFCSSSSPLS